MTDHSRRTFIRTASLGVAAVGAATVVPAAAASAATPDHRATAGPAHSGPFVAWVNDAHSGDVIVLVDDHEVVHHDPALARRLAAIAATARTA